MKHILFVIYFLVFTVNFELCFTHEMPRYDTLLCILTIKRWTLETVYLNA